MPILKPSGPRPFINKDNTTVQDLIDHIAKIVHRAREADEKLLPAEYDALIKLIEATHHILNNLKSSARLLRDANKPKAKPKYSYANELLRIANRS